MCVCIYIIYVYARRCVHTNQTILQTDRRTDGPTDPGIDGKTDKRTDGRTMYKSTIFRPKDSRDTQSTCTTCRRDERVNLSFVIKALCR